MGPKSWPRAVRVDAGLGLAVDFERGALGDLRLELERAYGAGDDFREHVGERCGALLGHAALVGGVGHIRVVGAAMANHLESSRTHARLSTKGWFATADAAARAIRARIVGWWHTHPDMGLFLSGDDLRSHLSLFGAGSWEIAVVIEPRRLDAAVFTLDQGKPIAAVEHGPLAIGADHARREPAS
jgi:proteasome lid subunit RPN8/RPN11